MSLKAPLLQELRMKQDLKVFIETGTYDGGGVYQALLAGFQEVHSIEASRGLWIKAVNNVGGSPGVYLHLGDSGEVLHWTLARVRFQPCLICLDAHTVPGLHETATRDDSQRPHCPLLEELESIYHLPPGSGFHTVLIDDIDMAGTPVFDGITKEMILKCLAQINPLYKLTYVDGARKDSLLVASYS